MASEPTNGTVSVGPPEDLEAWFDERAEELLPEPACPACGTQFYDLVERGWLRKKPTLVGDGRSAE